MNCHNFEWYSTLKSVLFGSQFYFHLSVFNCLSYDFSLAIFDFRQHFQDFNLNENHDDVAIFSATTETVDIKKLYVNGHVEVAVAWLTHFSLLVIFRIMAWTLIIICAGW